MSNSACLFTSFVFFGIALFLVFYTWVPSYSSLGHGAATVARIVPYPNTWYEVEIVTDKGERITCRSRRGFPLFGPALCPIEEFEPLLGRTVDVMHDGQRPYEVKTGGRIVIAYSSYRWAQILGIGLAGGMLAMVFGVWWMRRR